MSATERTLFWTVAATVLLYAALALWQIITDPTGDRLAWAIGFVSFAALAIMGVGAITAIFLLKGTP